MQRHLIFAILAATLMGSCSGCSSAPAQPTSTPMPISTEQPTETPSPRPTDTPSPSSTPEPTDNASPTPSATPLPESLREQILETWRPLTLVQANVEMLAETAARVESGELEGFESFGTLIVLASFVEAVDESLPGLEPMPELEGQWNDMVVVHEKTKELLAAWYDEEIEATQVIADVEHLLTDADNAMGQVERILARDYQLPSEELTATRQELMQEMRDIIAGLETPTP